MPEKKKNKIRISKFLIVTLASLIIVLLVLFFGFSKVSAPPSEQSPISPASVPTESSYILNIGKISLSAPIIINVDGNDKNAYDQSLKNGVAHLKGSALPGAAGNVFIFGHSSYYAWDNGNYKEIFKNLNDLAVGDVITINSNLKTYNYKITDKKIVDPSDVSVADQNFSEKKLTLMTCWPIGSDKERLVVVGLLQE